jgi:sulfate adenylyltransferase
MIQPHGGSLVNKVNEEMKVNIHHQCVQLDQMALSDFVLIASGAYSPLTGFMGQKDYHSVVHTLRLANHLPWSIPITLPVDGDTVNSISKGTTVNLVYENTVYGVMEITDIYTPDKLEEAKHVYQTTDPKHPGVSKLVGRASHYLGGPITLIKHPKQANFQNYLLTPSETRATFNRLGWDTIVGFQTRNPIHRAHEYIQKSALETVDGLFIHPLVGETKSDDIPSELRMECYQILLQHYYPKERVHLSVFPAAMRYAGPREALFHALVRKNYGCTHFIVGRDHAGVGNYYGTYDSQKIFERFTKEEIGIQIFRFENSFYCLKCESMGTDKTCPHEQGTRVSLSGTKVRTMLREGKLPPKEFSRPEVASLLMKGMSGAFVRTGE